MTSHYKASDSQSSGSHYWAFISYSQRDAKHAQRLHKELETFHVPRGLIGQRKGNHTIPRRLLPIFRDRDELPSASDLTGKICEALEASRALIVICSPYAAASPRVNEEIRTFKVLGRADRIFPLIVDGEPYASQRPDLGLPECFPPALRFAVEADGTLTDRRSDPLAADARGGQDGWSNSCLKLVAGILGIGFDDLRRRELVRQRRRRRMAALAFVAAAVVVAALYVGLADDDVNVPWATEIRFALDRQGASVFRPVLPRAEIVQKASATRRQLRTLLVKTLMEQSTQQDVYRSVWDLGQIAGAIYRDPDAGNDEMRLLPPMLDRIFQHDFLLIEQGKPVGWTGDSFSRRVEAALWMMMALSQALGRKDGEIDPVRARYAGYLETVQEIAESYYPLHDGGWNVTLEDKPEDHSLYGSALALHALLELDSAALCWRGDCERLGTMIRETAQLFIRTFANDEYFVGWRWNLDEGIVPDPDLRLMVYAALSRVPVAIPDSIQIAALRHLSDLRFRPYHLAYHDIRHWVTAVNDQGKRDYLMLSTRVFWYPWATEALLHWQRYAKQRKFPPATTLALERSLGHVVVADSADLIKDMSGEVVYAIAESYYGLGGLR
jgi:MTH538 TIR-like domain (DUF1863)